MAKVIRNYKFAAIPEWVIFHADLSPLAVRVFGILDRHGHDPQTCFPSHERIGVLAGVSPRSIARPIAELEAVGAVRALHRGKATGGRTSDGYFLAGDTPLPPVTALLSALTDEGLPRNEAAPYRAPVRGSKRAGERAEREQGEREQENEKTPSPPTGGKLAPDYGFAVFWDAWPERNGKKLAPGKAKAIWARLDLEERRAAYRGAVNYSDASRRGLQGAKDAFRWLRDREWTDWQTPAVATPKVGAQKVVASEEAVDKLAEHYGRAGVLAGQQGPPPRPVSALPSGS